MGKPKMLWFWWIENAYVDCVDGVQLLPVAHGLVTGHPKFPEFYSIHTSAVLEVKYNGGDEVVIQTMNSEYHLLCRYCDFSMQDRFPDLIPGYEEISEKHYTEFFDFPPPEYLEALKGQ